MGGLWALDYLAVSHVFISDPHGGALKLEVQGKHKPGNRKNNGYSHISQGCDIKWEMQAR